MSLLSQVRRTLLDRKLLEPGARVLVACSGGPDSAALLAVLAALATELRLHLEAASVDHGLRADAQLDVGIARKQAATLGIPFHALQVEVEAGASMQGHARHARYQALHTLARAQSLQRIATGHTQDDQAETVVARMLRGAGIRGLSAIEPHRADGVVRPLIDCARNDVHAFVRDRFESIALDSSNHNPRFERVRVRNELMPAMRLENPAVAQHLAQLADEARDVTNWVRSLADQALLKALRNAETLTISVLDREPAPLRPYVLRAWLEPHIGPLTGAHLRQIAEACTNARGEVWLSATHQVLAHRDGTLRLQVRNVSAPDSTP